VLTEKTLTTRKTTLEACEVDVLQLSAKSSSSPTLHQ